jgi:hypothetical protein
MENPFNEKGILLTDILANLIQLPITKDNNE